MGKSLLEVSYSSDYEVGWASLVQVTEVGEEFSYSSDYEVGWANHT